MSAEGYYWKTLKEVRRLRSLRIHRRGGEEVDSSSMISTEISSSGGFSIFAVFLAVDRAV